MSVKMAEWRGKHWRSCWPLDWQYRRSNIHFWRSMTIDRPLFCALLNPPRNHLEKPLKHLKSPRTYLKRFFFTIMGNQFAISFRFDKKANSYPRLLKSQFRNDYKTATVPTSYPGLLVFIIYPGYDLGAVLIREEKSVIWRAPNFGFFTLISRKFHVVLYSRVAICIFCIIKCYWGSKIKREKKQGPIM